MVISYDNRKKSYDSMDDSQKQQYNDMLKNKGDDYVGNQYMKQYNQQTNNTPQSNNNSSNFNNQNGTNWQNNVSTDQFTNFVKWGIEWYNSAINNSKNNSNEVHDYYNDFNNKVEEYKKTHPERDSTEYDNYKKQFDSYWTYSPDLDQTKFNQDPWKITVQEWTAQQTWLPDYQASSEARLNEMKGNLDHYFATSPRMFSDRETFNRVFEYNNRDSEAQRQLLDSYWKRKEDMDKASQYTSWESIMNWLKNSQITTDQLNLIKENDPEAYRKWQELQEEEIKKRIVNDIVPPLMSDIANQINDMINMLWIQAQEALDIEWIYNDTMDRTWAYQTLEDCNRTVRQIEAITNKKTAIMNRYAASTWGTVSDALAAARMQKAIAPYNEQLQGLQYQYQDYSNLYSQKSATALQAANVRALQANENQRIWNQKTAALGFATNAMSYRTPEQQKQLDLQYQQAQNEMQLLQQSRLNDLNRYNQYATAKMQNQLQQELTDLSVEDEAQLKANLNNALSDYYKNYGNIIQRSQSQAVDDIIAYAKKKGISVAQAMTENFIKPLQNKAEYKQKIASDYGMIAKQSITSINWKSVIMTTNPNGTISYKYINDWAVLWEVWDAKPYDMVDSKVFDTSPQSHSYYTLWDFINDPDNKVWTYGGQCAKFVNDYLEKIWVGRYFGNENAQTRASWCNSDTARVWTVAVFDYGHTSSDWINHGHVWIVVDTDANGFWVLDSNYDTKNPKHITKRYILNWSSSCKWFFDPSKQASPIINSSTETKFEWNGNTYDFTKYSWWKDLTDDERLTVESLLTYQTDPSTLPKSWKENGASNSRVRAAASAIGRDYGYNERKFKEVKTIEDQRYKAAWPWGSSSANSTAMSILKAISDSFSDLENYDINTVNTWINQFKTETWDPTVWALYTDMRVASSEIAKALKWWASPTTEEINDIKSLLNGNMWEAQAKEVFKHFAKNLYEKNESEALNFYRVTWYKPEPIYTDEAAKWLTNSMWVDLSRYYNYNWWVATWPKDEATRYYDGLQIGNKTYSNSELDDMVDEIFNS